MCLCVSFSTSPVSRTIVVRTLRPHVFLKSFSPAVEISESDYGGAETARVKIAPIRRTDLPGRGEEEKGVVREGKGRVRERERERVREIEREREREKTMPASRHCFRNDKNYPRV